MKKIEKPLSSSSGLIEAISSGVSFKASGLQHQRAGTRCVELCRDPSRA